MGKTVMWLVWIRGRAVLLRDLRCFYVARLCVSTILQPLDSAKEGQKIAWPCGMLGKGDTSRDMVVRRES